jgi:hemerythrin-like metal-binding protein
MTQYIWDEKYSVNNEVLDNHHKRLFVILNNLQQCCYAKAHRVTISSIVEELLSYASHHCEVEERHMKSIGYKHIRNHASEHRLITDIIYKQQYKRDIKEVEITLETVSALAKMLIDHILNEDMKYAKQ